MKNIKLEKSGEAVTIHTPHGRVEVRVLGGPTVGEEGWNRREAVVTVVPLRNEHHFVQGSATGNDPMGTLLLAYGTSPIS